MKPYFFALFFLCSFALFAQLPPSTPEAAAMKPHLIDLGKVFLASPLIYTFLSLMSVASLSIWIYSLATFRPKEIMPEAFRKELRTLLESEHYEHARSYCEKHANLLASIITAGLSTRKLGPQVMVESMKSEGKRVSAPFWQRLSLLNDIAMVAPMLGLLGTVIGMFYAFYDVNRSIESINSLFDGLGIAVGTTVVGLVVAILAMIFATTLKYRLVQTLSHIESEALSLSSLIAPEQSLKMGGVHGAHSTR